uniref:Uncharacterized protein LOC105136496 n=1 Tax=Rhizophora mucronata TaxID=61149 RepID=A0A2P2IRV6_RHIMU
MLKPRRSSKLSALLLRLLLSFDFQESNFLSFSDTQLSQQSALSFPDKTGLFSTMFLIISYC